MNFLVNVLFLILKAVLPLLPLRLVRLKARVMGAFFYYIIPVRKKVAFSNIRLAFPDKNKREINSIIKGCYENVFTVIGEFFCMNGFTDEKLNRILKIANPELLQSSLNKGKGVIFISAHFGNWELLAYGGARVIGKRFNVIVKEQSNKKLDEAINKIRSYSGNRMFEMRESIRSILSCLHSGEIVAMLGDQSAPKENTKIDFFVKNITAFEGTARIAIKTRAALMFTVSIRNKEGNYDVFLHEVDTSKYKDSTEENVRSLTQEHFNLLKEEIIKNPDHWLWFHRRFKNV